MKYFHYFTVQIILRLISYPQPKNNSLEKKLRLVEENMKIKVGKYKKSKHNNNNTSTKIMTAA